MDEELKKITRAMEYITPKLYVNGRITEYDIRSANITMLRKAGMIDEEYYNHLSSLPKFDREKEVGLLEYNLEYYRVIHKGIIQAKRKLIELNQIDINSIIRIANDAVFINKSYDLPYTSFDDVEFRIKSIYTSMIRLDKLTIFFRYLNNNLDISIKGISDDKLQLHENMITLIANALYLLEKVSPEESLSFVNDMIISYVQLKLPVGFYRELNGYSMFKFKYKGFYMSNIDNVNDIDIGYNLYILRTLWSIILQECNLK